MAMSLSDKMALLRLQNGYSKQQIADRLQVTEDTVTAWESGAAAPDLALLPKIAAFYGITVDELLSADAPKPAAQQTYQQSAQQHAYGQPQQQASYQHAWQQPNQQTSQQQSWQQPNQQTAQQQAHRQQTQRVADGIFKGVFGLFDKFTTLSNRRNTARLMFIFPFPLLIVAAYIFVGTVMHLWHPTWIMFLLIPCYYMIAAALRARSQKAFLFIMPVPIVIVMLFLLIGFGLHIWHPTWILFLLIPVYYWFVAFFVKSRRGF